MGKVVALGGGVFMGDRQDQWPVKMRPIHEEILALSGSQHPKVLYIPTAADDLEERIKGFRRYYAGLGCEVDVLRLLDERPGPAEITSKIASADIIYVTGGNTHRMIATWKRYGVDMLLKQAYAQGTVMAGHSAGAICWFNYGCSDSFYKQKPFRVTALGIINGLLCPHYDSESVRQPALKKIMKRTNGMVAIALDEYAALEVVDGRYRFLTADPSAKTRRAKWKAGKYIVEELKPSKEFQDLKGLLQP
ncbi:MAG TPA: peptidase E [Candidatus Dormibacteraeota bacterium]|nr:peptidase E [Candidatus Dormibacteraeota bacterium]